MAIWSICLQSLLINSGSTYINSSISDFHQPPNSWWTFLKTNMKWWMLWKECTSENMMISTPRILCIELLFHIHGSIEIYILRPPHIAVDLAPAISWPNPWLVLFPGKFWRGNTQHLQPFTTTAQFPWGEIRSSETEKKMLWKMMDSFKNTISRRCLTVPCPKSGLEPGVLTVWVLLKKVFVLRSF